MKYKLLNQNGYVIKVFKDKFEAYYYKAAMGGNNWRVIKTI